MNELEFAFEEYKDNPENFINDNIKLDKNIISVKYCKKCGFPKESCTCTLDCLI